ncbi:MAG TPA: MopE-related protein [Sandaracinaceae bacterium LLY-WYZ-13_1]|nr:MopE-related protein [Sandaracinaceae bacterium LLY-WYZ-13_1]
MGTLSSPPTLLASKLARALRRGGWLAPLTLALALGAMGCATGMDDEEDAGGGGTDAAGMDAGRSDGGGGDDGGAIDGAMATDGGADECGGACDPFQYCDSGTCRDYPACRGDGTCDRPGDVCHNRRCVPGDVDIDGDGSPAAEDCDETDPERFPEKMEECNSVDDDCDENVDEGDPAVLCESYPGGGICVDGSCGCPSGTFDLDRSVPGCECVAAPPLDQGVGCEGAIDLGDLNDSGQMLTVSGNVMPDDREVWYRFRGVDQSDTSCDNYHVRVQFTTNPDDTFEFSVFRGGCSVMAACGDEGFTDYDWATDFRQDIGGTLTGQCPCYAAGATPMSDVSVCEDDSTEYLVRVRRRAGSELHCDSYTIEISNGIYDTM